ncbi:MAG: cytidylyltransferase domain-containing protein [Opitutales bacterium]
MSTKKDLSVILPMRKGSERVPNKNTKPFAGIPFGLAELKLSQLLQLASVDQIIIDTNEPRISEIVENLNFPHKSKKRIRIEERDPAFAGNEVTTDSLIAYLGQKIETTHALWTHTTSPFVDSSVYHRAIDQYFSRDPIQNDSLMSVTRLQEFIWDETGPKNYDYSVSKWPRTQTLPPWYFINSAIFCCPTEYYVSSSNRIGSNPILFEMDKIVGFDVDWPIDFEIAELIYKASSQSSDLYSKSQESL